MHEKSAKALTASKAIGWQPARWGPGRRRDLNEVAQEFREGDRVKLIRNNYRADPLNGHTAEVVAIDPQGGRSRRRA